MAINYPGSLDDFTNPSAGNTLDSPSHSGQHTDINDAVEALQTKIGIGDSPAGSATAGQVLTAQGGGTAIWDNLPADTSALTHITTITTGSAVATVNVNDVFSADYTNYKIILEGALGDTTAVQLRMRLRVSGTDATGSDYNHHRIFGQSSGTTVNVSANGQVNESSAYIGVIIAAEPTFITMDIFRPFLTQQTYAIAQGLAQERAWHEFENNRHKLSNSYTGFTLFASSGNVNIGSLKVYGYKD